MFLILALPRSRTYWLSKFLSYGDFDCGHDEARYLRSWSEAKVWLSRAYHGSAETSLSPFWRLLPDMPIVVVRRPVEDCIESFLRINFGGICTIDPVVLERNFYHFDRKLTQLAARRSVLEVQYADLDNVETIRRVWEHCLPYPFDAPWWHSFVAVNLQCNMRAMMRYALAHRAEMERMAKTAAAMSRVQLQATPPKSSDGVTFQQEEFDDWLRDGVPLFREHLVEVGESPDNWQNKNIPLMQQMSDAGYLQITTARLNGKMFGYLAAVVNPSLEVRNQFGGLHNTFYVSKDMPGIGLKLQRASIAALKSRGAAEVMFFEGTRGSGPRLGTLYRRLGAEEAGKLYRLNLAGQG